MLMHTERQANKMNISSSGVFSTVILNRYKRIGIHAFRKNRRMNKTS